MRDVRLDETTTLPKLSDLGAVRKLSAVDRGARLN
jgi:hypothetical protein